MNDVKKWFAAVDWAREKHDVRITDATGKTLGECVVKHSGSGLIELCDWLIAVSGGTADAIHVAIETPKGPVVAALLVRGFNVWSINPKQVDRFRDRFRPAGSKDDSLDTLVMASALRTDPERFRKVEIEGQDAIRLHTWSRLNDELIDERTRLSNRLRNLLWSYFPSFNQLDRDIHASWLLALWTKTPTPEQAGRLRPATVAKLLKEHRIRRIDAEQVLEILRQTPMPTLPGIVEAAVDNIRLLIQRLRLVNDQIKEIYRSIDQGIAELAEPLKPQTDPQVEHRDAEILASFPGLGRINVAAMLTEPGEALRNGDYQALRTLSGMAPVTIKSGKREFAIRRHACNQRLAKVMHNWARTAIQHDPISRAKYDALRARGKTYAHALRAVADRLLYVVCTMLRNRTLFDPNRRPKIILAPG